MDVFQAGLAFGTQTANTVYAGPTSGSAAAPAFRAVNVADLPNGTVIQRVYAEYTANTSITAVIPGDDTIPQNTEGTQILTASITPLRTTSRVRARFAGFGAPDGVVGVALTAALFRNSGADAIQATIFINFNATNGIDNLVMEFEDSPGATSAQTYNVRVGVQAAGNLRMNGNSGARLYGGAARSTLVLEELAA